MIFQTTDYPPTIAQQPRGHFFIVKKIDALIIETVGTARSGEGMRNTIRNGNFADKKIHSTASL